MSQANAAQGAKQTGKVITGETRFSFCQLWEPKAMEPGQKEKYSVSLIIPKKDKKTIANIEVAIKAALEAGKVKLFEGKVPSNWHNPLRDGDEERPNDPNYADSYFISAKSDTQPGIIDANKDEIMDKKELYSGCYGRASLNFYPFNKNGKKGVACGLNNIQKLRDGESFSGRQSAFDDFADDDLLG